MAKGSTGKSGGIGKGKGKRRGGPKAPEFSDFLTKVRKELCPEVGCSTAAMHLMNDLMSKFADRMIAKTGELARYDKKETMKWRHASTAGNMILIGPMSGHAFESGKSAVEKFTGKPIEV